MLKHKSMQERNKYGNILVLSPSGEQMFRCNEKKCKWYISRGLAKLEEKNDEKILQLLFQPKGYGNADIKVLLEKQQNICVVCGASENIHKHHLIPTAYFKLYPEQLKSHRWDNLIVLCQEHGRNFEILHGKYKKFLSKQFNAPINGIGLKYDRKLIEAIKAAHVLLDKENIIPDDILEKKRCILDKYFYGKSHHVDDLINLIKLKREDCLDKTNYKSHAQLLMNQINNPETFVEQWKAYFVTHMKPKFLPAHLKYLEK